MPLNYMPTFIRLCKKLSVYVAEHDHHMLVALEKSEYVTEEENNKYAIYLSS
jgi:hypothetical protein